MCACLLEGPGALVFPVIHSMSEDCSCCCLSAASLPPHLPIMRYSPLSTAVCRCLVGASGS